MIEIQNVSVSYGGEPVLRELNLGIEKGSFHFLTGPSGSGKSTFFRLLTGEIKPASGHVRVFGHDIGTLPDNDAARLRRRIGIVPQDNPMLGHLTAWDNVAVPLLVLGRRRAEFAPDIDDLMKWVGLDERKHSYPKSLSGGELQRIGIARAVIGRPELLLADEPTSGVDSAMASRLLRLFAELNSLGTAVIIATHDIAMMERFDAERLVISDGRLTKRDGKPA